MELGVTVPSFAGKEWRLPLSRLTRWVQRAEEHGFAGAWVFDHLVEPPTYQTTWLDPFVVLSHIAAETEQIPIGTDILILPLRNPVLTASQAATLQHVSQGRLTLGMGLGYVEDEFEAANVPFDERSTRFTEGLELMDRLLHDDEPVTFDGEFYQVEELEVDPSPTRPVRLLGGGGGVDVDGERKVARAVKDRIVSTDGWIAGPWTPEIVRKDWNHIAKYAESQGQDPEKMDRTVVNLTHLVPDADTEEAIKEQRRVIEDFVGENGWKFAKRNYILGSVEDIRETLAEYEDSGVDQVILSPATSDMHELDRQLDLWNKLLRTEFN